MTRTADCGYRSVTPRSVLEAQSDTARRANRVQGI